MQSDFSRALTIKVNAPHSPCSDSSFDRRTPQRQQSDASRWYPNNKERKREKQLLISQFPKRSHPKPYLPRHRFESLSQLASIPLDTLDQPRLDRHTRGPAK
jgi:hypothetical protein